MFFWMGPALPVIGFMPSTAIERLVHSGNTFFWKMTIGRVEGVQWKLAARPTGTRA